MACLRVASLLALFIFANSQLKIRSPAELQNLFPGKASNNNY